MEIKIYCPKCGQDYVIEDYKEGMKVECAKCGHSFLLSKESTKNPFAKSAPKPMLPPKPHSVRKSNVDVWGYRQPVLCNLFNAFGILGAIGAVLIILSVVANGGRGGDYAIIPWFICISDCLVCFAISRGISYIAEIRHHSVKQTEMMAQILAQLKK